MARLGAMSSMLAARAEELVENNDAPAPKLVAVRAEEKTAPEAEAASQNVPAAAVSTDAEASPAIVTVEEDAQTEEKNPGEGDDSQDEQPGPASAAPVITEEPKPAKKTKATGTKRRATKADAPMVPPPPAEANGRAHYTELIRKELRLHPGQSADLTILTVTLHNAKRGRGERITDNTIMRIALDLLLERKHELKGTTEDELRASVGLSPVQYDE